MIQVKVVNKKLVKPCTPTPQNLKNYKLSFIDEFAPPYKFGVLLFYASQQKQKQNRIVDDLEESLAKVLVPFYPLAGRLRIKYGCVDCSDEGAEFVEAEAPNAELAALLVERNLDNLDGLMPRNVTDPHHDRDEASYPLLTIQITHLPCGGLVIGIAVSHRIFDAASLRTFIAAWSNATANYPAAGGATIIPALDSSSSLFPAKIQNSEIVRNNNTARPPPPPPPRTIVAKRFAFNEEAIARVRSKLRPKVGGARPYSRVRVVCAFLAKCLIGVDRGGASTSRRRRPCYVSQVINFRERTIPPLPKHSCGNYFVISCIEIPEFPCPDADMGIQGLVDVMSDAIDKTVVECGEILRVGQDRLKEMIVESKASESGEAGLMIIFSDLSKLGLYDVDFGWGKPVWASIVLKPERDNAVVLMESKEGNGVEAWVFLDKDDMTLFEQDGELGMLCNLANI